MENSEGERERERESKEDERKQKKKRKIIRFTYIFEFKQGWFLSSLLFNVVLDEAAKICERS